MKRILLLVAVVAMGLTAGAQHRCISTEVTEQLRATNPNYDRELKEQEQALQKWVATNQQDPNYSARAVRTIPVAVHVVYNTTAQNVSDATVQALIAKLNKDYRKLNSDLPQARSVVQALASDVEIEFCLAQRTPAGQPTNGIEHVQTNVSCFDQNSGPNDMKSTTTGGANPWNPQKYLNIWIVYICGNTANSGVGGYAYLPTTGVHGSSIDGLVIDYRLGVLGTDNYTMAHEIGHYLGLHHTWGDLSSNACGNSFPSTDDGFNDTPDSRQPNLSTCPYNNFSCTGNSSYGDQVENFMDYSSCAVMFTTQQANYMNNILSTTRASLITNNPACTPTGGPIAGFTANPTTICTGQTVQFTNTSTGSNLTYSWSFPGGTPSTSTAQNPTVTYNTAGTYSVTLVATSGGQNNTATQTNYITVSGSNALPLTQGFESTTFPPTGWALTNGDNSTTWVRTTSASGYGASGACTYINNYNYSTVGQKDWLITPSYNFSSTNAGRIRWDYAYARYPQSGSEDTLEIMYSINCGATWTSLWKRGGTALATANSTTSNFVPSSSQWRTDSVSLASLNGQQNVRFAFVSINKYGNNIFLDNVNVYNASTQSQAPVADFVGVPTTVVAGNTVSFTDLSTNNPTSWSWSFPGGTPTTSTAQNPTITYSTPGTYNVTLTATNATGNNSVTKTAYITVIQQGAQSCDTLSNFTATDTLVFYSLVQGGYIAGHNALGHNAIAQYYPNSTTAQVTGGLFYFVIAKTLNPATSSITAKVWAADGTGGAPGTELGSQSYLISNIAQAVTNQDLTYIPFSSPPTVTGNYYIGFQMTYLAGDTVAMVSSTTNSPNPDYGWLRQSNNTWATFNTIYGVGLDMAILPIVCTGSTQQGPTASFTAGSTAVCAGGSVTYTSTSTGSPTSYSWVFPGGTPSTSTSASPTVTYATAGTYNVSLTVSNGNGSNSTTQTNYITVRPRPTLAFSSNPVACFGGSTGSASVTASGASTPYTYSWSGGGSTSSITNKPAGQYGVTVSDVNQCTASGTVNIGQPLDPVALTMNTSAAYCGQNNGSVSVNPTGGSGSFTYTWSNGLTTQTISNVGAGNYSVTAVDANSCSATASASLTNQNVSVAVTVNTTAACNGSSGTASAVVTNSTQGVSSYAWSNSATTGSITGLAAGSYSVTVTLANGCTGTATGQVTTATAPTATLAPTDGNCQTGPAVNLTAGGGSAPYTYNWSNGAITEDINNVPAGAYSITVTDNNGCTATATTSVADNSTVNTSFNAQNPTSGNNGSITVTASGGSTPYTYNWSNGGNTATITGLAAGTYTVTVTDQAGCIKVSSVTLTAPVGIPTVENIADIKVYPNPASNLCKVQVELAAAHDMRIEMLNSLGQQVYEKTYAGYQSGIETVDLAGYAAGVYVVKVHYGQHAHTIRLIKQ